MALATTASLSFSLLRGCSYSPTRNRIPPSLAHSPPSPVSHGAFDLCLDLCFGLCCTCQVCFHVGARHLCAPEPERNSPKRDSNTSQSRAHPNILSLLNLGNKQRPRHQRPIHPPIPRPSGKGDQIQTPLVAHSRTNALDSGWVRFVFPSAQPGVSSSFASLGAAEVSAASSRSTSRTSGEPWQEQLVYCPAMRKKGQVSHQAQAASNEKLVGGWDEAHCRGAYPRRELVRCGSRGR